MSLPTLSTAQAAAVQQIVGAAHAQSCPGCGSPLQPVVLGPDSAPWLCPVTCHRGWWNSELSPAARSAYRRRDGDFGFGGAARAIQASVDVERIGAMARGTSALPEHLPMLPTSTLTYLATRVLSAAFLSDVQVEIARRGAQK